MRTSKPGMTGPPPPLGAMLAPPLLAPPPQPSPLGLGLACWEHLQPPRLRGGPSASVCMLTQAAEPLTSAGTSPALAWPLILLRRAHWTPGLCFPGGPGPSTLGRRADRLPPRAGHPGPSQAGLHSLSKVRKTCVIQGNDCWLLKARVTAIFWNHPTACRSRPGCATFLSGLLGAAAAVRGTPRAAGSFGGFPQCEATRGCTPGVRVLPRRLLANHRQVWGEASLTAAVTGARHFPAQVIK